MCTLHDMKPSRVDLGWAQPNTLEAAPKLHRFGVLVLQSKPFRPAVYGAQAKCFGASSLGQCAGVFSWPNLCVGLFFTAKLQSGVAGLPPALSPSHLQVALASSPRLIFAGVLCSQPTPIFGLSHLFSPQPCNHIKARIIFFLASTADSYLGPLLN